MEDSMYKRMLRRSVLLGTAILLVIAGTVSVANAANLCVRPSGAGGCYTSIQAAVDAANSGDQIIIRSGKYTEQVTIIGKDLTLVGRDNAVVQAPAVMEQTLIDLTGSRPIIGVANAEVTIRNLIVDGLNSAANNPFIEGITFMDAGGVIRDNVIRNVGFGEPTLPIDETTGAPLYQGDPIVVVNLAATPRTVTIAENLIVNYNDIGIVVGSVPDPSTATGSNLTAHILDNTLIGMGANDVIDQWGMSLFTDGVDDPLLFLTGTVSGNRVRDMVTVDPFPFPGIGIFTFGNYNMHFTDNVVDNSNVGINAVRAFSAVIAENRLTGSSPVAPGNTGLFLAGSDGQVRNNRFRKFDIGIFLSIDNEFIGITYNTVLDDNRFENVPADVLTSPGPLAAATDSAARNSSTRWQRFHNRSQP
jgi:hypothetical protein